MSDKKQEFISKMPESNTEWAAIQIIDGFSKAEFKKLQASFKKLDELLYKSWAKQLTLEELMNALEIAEEVTVV